MEISINLLISESINIYIIFLYSFWFYFLIFFVIFMIFY